MKTTTAILAAALGLALQAILPAPVLAGEGIRPAGPIGGTDIRQAILPPGPGLYGVGVGVNGRFPDYLTEDGHLDSDGQFIVGGIGLLAVYPFELFGGRLASSIFMSGGQTCFRIKPMPDSCSDGMGDPYADVLMWSRHFPSRTASPAGNPFLHYGLDTLVGLGLSIPAGVYDRHSPVNNGSNVYDIAPNFALTYTTPSVLGPALGDATEFSARVFYNYYTRNDANEYKSGDLISADFAVTQRRGAWQFGLTGTGFVQIEDDEIDGVPVPGGNRAKMLQLGPIVSHDFMAGGRPWNVTVKGLFYVDGQNAAAPNVVVLRIGTKLF